MLNSILYSSSTGEEAIRKGNLSDAVSLLRNAIQLGSKVYLPENQYFIRVRDTLAQALADSGKFDIFTKGGIGNIWDSTLDKKK